MCKLFKISTGKFKKYTPYRSVIFIYSVQKLKSKNQQENEGSINSFYTKLTYEILSVSELKSGILLLVI